MKCFFYQYVPFFFMVGSIFYFSSLSVLPVKSIFFLQDKVLHFLIFFALAYTLFRIFLYRAIPLLKAAIMVVILTTIYGLTDEIHQSYVPNRVFDYYDLLADFLGTFVSVIVGPYIFKLDKVIHAFVFNKNELL